jgi:Reverse transcriptase (RNA-dependent DNA polymerase)
MVEEEEAATEGPRRSSRMRSPVKTYIPSFDGQRYETTLVTQVEMSHNHEQVDSWTTVVHYTMIQLSMKAGLKHFGPKGEKAVTKELSQLHLQDTFQPVHPKNLSPEEKKLAVESHLFLKEKRDLSIKGRMVAGGDKQRGTMPAVEASSPTVSTEAVLLTSVIDATERRDVASIDIPNAYTQTRITDPKDKAIVRLRGKLAELMVQVAPEIYRKYIIINKKGQTVLYVRLLNVLYGILKGALLFYKKLTNDLLSIGFELNPYDPCVANKIIGGQQMTLCWHVDDMKISHKKKEAVDDMVLWLRHKYEEILSDGEGKMTVRRSKVHDYLGMTLDFSAPGEVRVDMADYVKTMIVDFREHDPSDKTAVTPAAEHLFQVRDDMPKISEKLAKIFHNFAARGLFATKRARPDIHTAISFLTTQVREPDDDDWKKLVRMMRYLRGTPDLGLTLSGKNDTHRQRSQLVYRWCTHGARDYAQSNRRDEYPW